MSDRPEPIAELLPALLRELLRGLLRGEAEALDRWYRAEHPQAYRLCLGFLADAVEAEDAAQDAMLHLLDHLKDFDVKRDYQTWRTSVVLNLCRDRQRRSRARQRAESSAARASELNWEAAHRRYISRPDGDAERNELQVLLTRCLNQLTPREREVFVLCDLSQLPTDRVSKLLDIGASSVRSLLALARRRMRTLLDPGNAAPGSQTGEVHGV